MKRVETKALAGWSGAASGELADGCRLAEEAWGTRADGRESSLIGAAYLLRRFGPPNDRHDDCVGAWCLSTKDPEVVLTVSPGAARLPLYVGYLVSPELADQSPDRRWGRDFRAWVDENPSRVNMDSVKGIERAVKAFGKPPPRNDLSKWRECDPIIQRVSGAMFEALRQLAHRCRVRDVQITIFGREE